MRVSPQTLCWGAVSATTTLTYSCFCICSDDSCGGHLDSNNRSVVDEHPIMSWTFLSNPILVGEISLLPCRQTSTRTHADNYMIAHISRWWEKYKKIIYLKISQTVDLFCCSGLRLWKTNNQNTQSPWVMHRRRRPRHPENRKSSTCWRTFTVGCRSNHPSQSALR